METIAVKTSHPYQVLVGGGLLYQVGELTTHIKPPGRAVMVSDDRVFGLYGATALASFTAAGYEVKTFVFPQGEASKNLNVLGSLLEYLAACRLSRTDLIIAMGGGVVGDLAGLAASIYLRGVDFIQIPTTLLAAVDSSVGGKTAVNLTAGKNLVGSFYQPRLVVCDVQTFRTLSQPVFQDGVCEVLKYGAIRDKNLFESITRGDIKENLEQVVSVCVGIKRDIVEADEFDRGERLLLNFGHTVGHAVEALSNYAISHGHGVAMGMAVACRCADSWGLSEENTAPLMEEALRKLGIDFSLPFEAQQITEQALSDKKRTGGKINLVLLKSIGKAFIHPVGIDELAKFFRKGMK